MFFVFFLFFFDNSRQTSRQRLAAEQETNHHIDTSVVKIEQNLQTVKIIHLDVYFFASREIFPGAFAPYRTPSKKRELKRVYTL